MEANRDRALKELEELAVAAEQKVDRRRDNFRRYSRYRNVFWLFAAVLAGLAGVLSVGEASTALTASAAFGSAFLALLEGKFEPAERRRAHAQAAADYAAVAWHARHAAKGEMEASDLDTELLRLHEAKHRLDREFGPDRVRRAGTSRLRRAFGRSRP